VHLLTVLVAPLCFAVAALAEIWAPVADRAGRRRVALEV
jgi:hypothetical protein